MMSASDEFPHGTSATLGAGGVTNANFVIPAIPGIAHVVTDISAFGWSLNVGAIVAATIGVVTINSVSLGAFTAVFAGVPASPAINTMVPYSGSWSGKLEAAIGEAVTINTNVAGGVAGQGTAFAIVGWYDI